MFKTYKIEVPSPLAEPAVGHTDKSAQQILQSLHPVILEDFIPAQVVGDGNCLYRAISRAMYGHEDNHLLLRLVTALEIAENRSNYDITAKDHVDMIRDDRVVLDTYDALLRAAARPGSFSDLLHMYAASAALNLPIHSYCPPTTFGSEFLSGPLTRRVYGRGVRQTAIPDVTIMWSQFNVPVRMRDFLPNHFTVLCKKDNNDSINQPIVDLTSPKMLHSTPTKDDEDEWPTLPVSPVSVSPLNIPKMEPLRKQRRRWPAAATAPECVTPPPVTDATSSDNESSHLPATDVNETSQPPPVNEVNEPPIVERCHCQAHFEAWLHGR